MLVKHLAFGLIILGVFPFAFAKGGNEDCWTCHGRKNIEKITTGGARSSVYVDEKEYIASAHAGNLCTSCHDDIKEMPHPERLKNVKCRECHRLETEIYLNSSHGKAVSSGIKEAATCESCHGKQHSILNSRNEKSPVNRRNIPRTCAVCHENEEKMRQFKSAEKTPVKTYRISVHGNAFKRENISAAVCSDCHGTHDLHPPADVKSKLYKFNVPGTCSKCHENEYITYKMSIHGKAIESKRKEAPVCTDCHGEHKIFAFSDPDSSVYSSAVSDRTCAPCHVSEQLITKFEMPADRVDTYKKSYHGIASKEGNVIVANCVSCHGFHDILPSSDPKSSTNPGNIKDTCGKCHAESSFSRFTHEQLSKLEKGKSR